MPLNQNPQVVGGLNSTSPAVDLVPITPDDNNDLDSHARSIRCIGTSGTLRVVTFAGIERNTSIESGEVLSLVATRVHATGTTATGLEAMI